MFINLNTFAQSKVESEAHRQLWNLNDVKSNEGNEFVNFYKLKQQFINYLCTGEKTGAKNTYLAIKKELNKKEKFFNSKRAIFKAELSFYMGVLEMAQGNRLKAAGHIKDSYSKHKSILKNYPNPISLKTVGFIEVMAANIPEKYHGLVKLMGVSPNKSGGLKKMKAACLSDKHLDDIWKKECVIYYAFALSKFNNKPALAGKMLLKETNDYATSPLSAYFRSLAYSFMGKNDNAIKVLPNFFSSNINRNRKLVEKFPFLVFAKGEYLLRSLKGNSKEHFVLYNNASKSSNYKATAQNYIGWIYLLNNDRQSYLNNMKKVKKYSAKLFKDKQAHKEVLKPISNISLLSARLLFDGGYFNMGILLLNTVQIPNLSKVDKLEYHYRLARLYHGNKNYSKAKYNYSICIQFGAETTRYFGANSALKIAEIYLKERKKDKAKYYFGLAANSFKNNTEYKSSIKQEANKQLKKL